MIFNSRGQRQTHGKAGCSDKALKGWDLWQHLFHLVWPALDLPSAVSSLIPQQRIGSGAQGHTTRPSDRAISDPDGDSRPLVDPPSVLTHSHSRTSLNGMLPPARAPTDSSSMQRYSSSSSLQASSRTLDSEVSSTIIRRLEDIEHTLKNSERTSSDQSREVVELKRVLRQTWRALVQSGSPEAQPGTTLWDLMDSIASDVLHSMPVQGQPDSSLAGPSSHSHNADPMIGGLDFSDADFGDIYDASNT